MNHILPNLFQEYGSAALAQLESKDKTANVELEAGIHTIPLYMLPKLRSAINGYVESAPFTIEHNLIQVSIIDGSENTSMYRIYVHDQLAFNMLLRLRNCHEPEEVRMLLIKLLSKLKRVRIESKRRLVSWDTPLCEANVTPIDSNAWRQSISIEETLTPEEFNTRLEQALRINVVPRFRYIWRERLSWQVKRGDIPMTVEFDMIKDDLDQAQHINIAIDHTFPYGELKDVDLQKVGLAFEHFFHTSLLKELTPLRLRVANTEKANEVRYRYGRSLKTTSATASVPLIGARPKALTLSQVPHMDSAKTWMFRPKMDGVYVVCYIIDNVMYLIDMNGVVYHPNYEIIDASLNDTIMICEAYRCTITNQFLLSVYDIELFSGIEIVKMKNADRFSYMEHCVGKFYKAFSINTSLMKHVRVHVTPRDDENSIRASHQHWVKEVEKLKKIYENVKGVKMPPIICKILYEGRLEEKHHLINSIGMIMNVNQMVPNGDPAAEGLILQPSADTYDRAPFKIKHQHTVDLVLEPLSDQRFFRGDNAYVQISLFEAFYSNVRSKSADNPEQEGSTNCKLVPTRALPNKVMALLNDDLLQTIEGEPISLSRAAAKAVVEVEPMEDGFVRLLRVRADKIVNGNPIPNHGKTVRSTMDAHSSPVNSESLRELAQRVQEGAVQINYFNKARGMKIDTSLARHYMVEHIQKAFLSAEYEELIDFGGGQGAIVNTLRHLIGKNPTSVMRHILAVDSDNTALNEYRNRISKNNDRYKTQRQITFEAIQTDLSNKDWNQHLVIPSKRLALCIYALHYFAHPVDDHISYEGVAQSFGGVLNEGSSLVVTVLDRRLIEDLLQRNGGSFRAYADEHQEELIWSMERIDKHRISVRMPSSTQTVPEYLTSIDDVVKDFEGNGFALQGEPVHFKRYFDEQAKERPEQKLVYKLLGFGVLLTFKKTRDAPRANTRTRKPKVPATPVVEMADATPKPVSRTITKEAREELAVVIRQLLRTTQDPKLIRNHVRVQEIATKHHLRDDQITRQIYKEKKNANGS